MKRKFVFVFIVFVVFSLKIPTAKSRFFTWNIFFSGVESFNLLLTRLKFKLRKLQQDAILFRVKTGFLEGMFQTKD